jgi:hypothetical protein
MIKNKVLQVWKNLGSRHKNNKNERLFTMNENVNNIVDFQVYDEVRNKVVNKLLNKLGNQIDNNVGFRVYYQLLDQYINQFDNNVFNTLIIKILAIERNINDKM